MDQQDAVEDAREAATEALIRRVLADGPAPADDDDDDDPDYTVVYEPNQNDEDEPPTRLEGEGVLDFLARFNPYWDSPRRIRGESNDDFRARQDRHQEKMRVLWVAAMTPADHAYFAAQRVSIQILEDAEEAAAELAMGPQPPATPEQLLEREAMTVRIQAALALLELEWQGE